MPSSVSDLLAVEANAATPRLRATVVELNGGKFDPSGRGPRWAGWYRVTRRPAPFVLNLHHGLGADVYGFHLHFCPGQGVPYSMPAGGGNGAATVPWTREWLYLHYEPDVPVFRAYSAEAGRWTAFNEGWGGALVVASLPPGKKAARLFGPASGLARSAVQCVIRALLRASGTEKFAGPAGGQA